MVTTTLIVVMLSYHSCIHSDTETICIAICIHNCNHSGSDNLIITVVSATIDRTINRSRVTGAAALYIFEAFDGVWHASILHKLRS